MQWIERILSHYRLQVQLESCCKGASFKKRFHIVTNQPSTFKNLGDILHEQAYVKVQSQSFLNCRKPHIIRQLDILYTLDFFCALCVYLRSQVTKQYIVKHFHVIPLHTGTHISLKEWIIITVY